MGNGTYKLTLDKATEFDFTSFAVDDVCYSIVNTLLEGGSDYFTSWLLVTGVDLNENSLTCTLYADGDVPGGKNHAPVAGYNLTRRGNAGVPGEGEVNERSQSWLLSSSEGRTCSSRCWRTGTTVWR